MHSVTPYIRNIYQGVRYFANITRYHTRNSMYPRTKSMAIPDLTVTRVAVAQQHCVQVSYTKFQPNRTADVASVVRNVFTPLNNVKTAHLSETQISEMQPTSLSWRQLSADSVNINWTDIAFHSIKEIAILRYI